MKSIFSRVLLIATLALTQAVLSTAQTTVTLPTIPCSTCNGPGAFSISTPACASGLVGAPLTMSWGAATGATSYTIMIATDAALTTDVATYTLTGTTLSVPAIALKPSVTYYWTVIANSSTGSTKATGSSCTFSTNTTWKGTSVTNGFPNGTNAQQQLLDGIAGGYYDCRAGDGTCASGDNMLCNPTFRTITTSTPHVPNWIYAITASTGATKEATGIDLIASYGNTPPSGTNTGVELYTQANNHNGYNQPMFQRNTSSSIQNYRLTFWARTKAPSNQPFVSATFGTGAFIGGSGNTQITPNSNWTEYNINIPLAAGATADFFRISGFDNSNGSFIAITDAILCKL